ncbi:MAG: hypothetical protein ACRDO4_00505 [Nocardioides sp.]
MNDAFSDGLSDDGLSEPAETITDQEAAALAEAVGLVGGEVSAVGLGSTDDGDPCVVVYASAQASDLPAEVAGLPVRVVVSDPILALDEDEDEG